jgi:hypothetical protein
VKQRRKEKKTKAVQQDKWLSTKWLGCCFFGVRIQAYARHLQMERQISTALAASALAA